MNHSTKLKISLLAIRLSVFLVMFVWTVDKFVNPGHASSIFQNFYSIPGLESAAIYAIATLEMVLLSLFLVGYQKYFTYGIVLILHSFSTFSSFAQYLTPFEGAHLLFFAAWPMWAACLTLFLLRDQDRLLSLG